MPHSNKPSAPVGVDIPELEGRYVDHTETHRAGDAYYAPPGHTPVVTDGTEVVEFSPTEELGRTMAVLGANLAAAAGAPA
jgi:hypothetical protein